MEQHCSTCDTTWVSNELVGCPTCQDRKKIVELSGTLKLVNPTDYCFAPADTAVAVENLAHTITQRPMTKWELFKDWLKNCWPFKPFIMGVL